MVQRMNVDPCAVPDASQDAPACPTASRAEAPAFTRLSAEEEALRRTTLPEAARRALEEADARRQDTGDQSRPTELGGRDGPEPVRYGDWELKGIAVDF